MHSLKLIDRRLRNATSHDHDAITPPHARDTHAYFQPGARRPVIFTIRHRIVAMAPLKLFACSVVLLMAATAMGYAAAEAGANKRRIARDISSSIFFQIPSFFGVGGQTAVDENGNAKPDFITSFDIIRLLDSKYAMKQFYCVVNEDSCDSLGQRLKASIPEAINRDCRRCTSTEMQNIQRLVNYVKQNYPQFWLRVEPLYKDK